MSPLHRILEWGVEGCTVTAELRLSPLNYAPQFSVLKRTRTGVFGAKTPLSAMNVTVELCVSLSEGVQDRVRRVEMSPLNYASQSWNAP